MTLPGMRFPMLVACVALAAAGGGASASADDASGVQVAPKGSSARVSHHSSSTPAGLASVAAPARDRDPVVAAVGDISDPHIRDQKDTSDLAMSWNPDAVLALGDTQYTNGTLGEFMANYDPTWGRMKAITHPVPGNHDYRKSAAKGYFSYFGALATPEGRSYYSFDLGSWHLVALNSHDDHEWGSDQVAWLRDDLASSNRRCVLAYWYAPRFSSGARHGSDPSLTPFWRALYSQGADVVLNGHEHQYERFSPQDPDGQVDQNGPREFVAGTGGRNLYRFGHPLPTSEVRYNDDFGVLQLTLHPSSYDWKFVSVGGDVVDSGTGTCH